jgi:hypothetical protein
LQIQIAEVLAGSDCEDERKNVSLLFLMSNLKTLVYKKDATNTQRVTLSAVRSCIYRAEVIYKMIVDF